MNRTLSRREKKKATDGVTLTGINQTGDQALQNKPSRWVPGSLHPWERSLGPLQGLGRPQPGHPGESSVGPPRDPREHLSTCCLLGKGPRASLGRVTHPSGARGWLATNVLQAPGQGKSWCQVLVIMCPQWKSLSVVSFRRAQVSWPGLYLLPGLCAGAGGGGRKERVVNSFPDHLFVESLAYF